MTKDPQDADREAADDDSADAVDLEAVLGEGEAVDEENALDLSDLDALGVDGVVARMRGGPPDPEQDADDILSAGIVAAPRRPRSPLISGIVLAVASYLLLTMFGDFRYWITSPEPIDLGEASALVASGRMQTGELHGKYVVLHGTPDVQHPARLTTKESYIGYLRIIEGRGSLFAALPRSKDEKARNTYEGRFEGRMTRLGSDRAFPWLEQFFGNETLTEPVDHGLPVWLQALREAGPGASLVLTGDDGTVEVPADDSVRIVADTPDVRVQLGRTSFTSAAAEQAVASLGYPWAAQTPTATFHSFIARIPESDRASALAILEQQASATEASNPADPALGVVLLPLRATYVAEAGTLRLADQTLSFPYGDNTTSPGHEDRGGKLVEQDLGEGRTMKLPLAMVSAVRYERPIIIDPDGYIIEHGADPAGERMAGILWLVVLGIATINVFSIVVWFRRRGH